MVGLLCLVAGYHPGTSIDGVSSNAGTMSPGHDDEGSKDVYIYKVKQKTSHRALMIHVYVYYNMYMKGNVYDKYSYM